MKQSPDSFSGWKDAVGNFRRCKTCGITVFQGNLYKFNGRYYCSPHYNKAEAEAEANNTGAEKYAEFYHENS